MKYIRQLKYVGMAIFLVGLAIFTAIPFLGSVKLTEEGLKHSLTAQEYLNLESPLRLQMLDKEFGSTFTFSRQFIATFNEVNEALKKEEAWEKVMWTPPGDMALKLSQTASQGMVVNHKWLFLLLTFGLGILGALIYIISTLVLQGQPGIKHDGIYHDA
ncbi:MAG: hypothetical protein R3279_08150, partial [Putridiphycobacter sp.]|nr:hypothetical protein [Putridiphycobacter sp.]